MSFITKNKIALLTSFFIIFASASYGFYSHSTTRAWIGNFIVKSFLGEAVIYLTRNEQSYDKHHVVSKVFNGMPIIVNNQDMCVSRSIRVLGYWERRIGNCLLRFLKPRQTIVEVGANYGYYTLLLAKAVGPQGKVYTFEANPDVYKYLEKTIELNHLKGVVQAKNLAVSDHIFKSWLIYGKENIGGGYIVMPGGKNGETCANNNPHCRPIEATTLDINLAHLKNVDLLRMDAEGSEVAILKSAQHLIDNSPKIVIIMEWSVETMKQYGNVLSLLNTFQSKGFRFWLIDPVTSQMQEKTKEEMLGLPHSDVVISRQDVQSMINAA
jgi:FkbM family methyltransferase